jgi:PAS domain S-box-containing protein
LGTVSSKRLQDFAAIEERLLFLGASIIAGSITLSVLNAKRKNEESGLKDIAALLYSDEERRALVSLDSVKNAISDMRLELNEARKREKAIIEKAIDVICVIDIHSRFISVSKSCLDAWGYTPKELEQKSLAELIQSEDSENIFNSILSSPNSIDKIVFECKLRRKDETPIDLIWTGHWSPSDGGLFCIVHDITERKRAEQLKREFTAMVTHELRSPIASVVGTITLLEDGAIGTLTEQGQKLIHRVNLSCKRLLKLTNELLDLEKMQAGKFRLEIKEIDLKDSIETAIDSLKMAANEKRIAVEYSGAEIRCFADEDRIIQVMINLISNAIKYSQEGTSIKIETANCENTVELAVCDSGRGIPEDKLGKIFDHYEQVDLSDAKRKGGTGLGLAICKSIIKEHGGEIGVNSKLGDGSRFWFRLPKTPA